jgi:hypothetical protein
MALGAQLVEAADAPGAPNAIAVNTELDAKAAVKYCLKGGV